MVRAIVGANWGDEGKGKITDVLAQKSDMVIRFQGGSNAGHTIINHYGKFALHQLPSGVFNTEITNIIGNGVALSVENLVKEIQELLDKGVPKPNILVSDRAQIVMPYHKLFDCYEEERLGGKSFGSTKSGIAPFYSDKFSKIGFQVNELKDTPLDLVKKELGDVACICGAFPNALLSFGTVEQVRDEVKRELDACAPGGGYMFSTRAGLTACKRENVVAMIETVREYGKY